MNSQVRKALVGLALAAVVIGTGLAFAQPAQADVFVHFGHVHHVEHPSLVHYHIVYHPTHLHWTPTRGLHTHGHYDLVPHVTPRRRVIVHGGHIHFSHGHHGLHGH